MTYPLNLLYILSSPIVIDGGGREGVIVLDGAGREGVNAR